MQIYLTLRNKHTHLPVTDSHTKEAHHKQPGVMWTLLPEWPWRIFMEITPPASFLSVDKNKYFEVWKDETTGHVFVCNVWAEFDSVITAVRPDTDVAIKNMQVRYSIRESLNFNLRRSSDFLQGTCFCYKSNVWAVGEILCKTKLPQVHAPKFSSHTVAVVRLFNSYFPLQLETCIYTCVVCSLVVSAQCLGNRFCIVFLFKFLFSVTALAFIIAFLYAFFIHC